ncbi:cupin domain-containing protein [Phragmitibacter flavus]|uniref:Cupin domain-containing protein n=1 Tax=Phragmitibacter flavus TaxID=2576071 RepID=A0A5R8KDA4_9BACT|nr:cupin domain-containing protein [Phragmitibacter flavus]TLD70280.1 cupin domain-containing protein [Phragmitibacter flavus]
MPTPQSQSQSQSDRILDFAATGMWWEVTKTTEETNGASFEAINIVVSGFEGPPLHIHPHAEEIYSVLEGKLDVYVNGQWRTLGPGETATVPVGVPHTLKNPHPTEVRLINIHQPALDIERMFRRMHRLIADGKLTLPPKSFSATVLISMLFVAHSKEIRSIKPPHLVMGAFAILGKCLGYRLPV